MIKKVVFFVAVSLVTVGGIASADNPFPECYPCPRDGGAQSVTNQAPELTQLQQIR